jgi:hypothetical protein
MAQEDINTKSRTAQATKGIAATFGISLVAVETWLNAEYIGQGTGLFSPMVVGTIAITLAGAAAIPFGERLLRQGQWLKAAGLICIFFPLVAALSFSSSLERSGTRRDTDVASHHVAAVKKDLAKQGLEDAQRVRDAECGKRGPRCRAAEKAVDEARTALNGNLTTTAQSLEDGMATRIAGLLSFMGVSEKGIALYQPLLMPFSLLVGGFLFIAVGFAPAHLAKAEITTTTPEVETEKEVVKPKIKMTPKHQALVKLQILAYSSPNNRFVASYDKLAAEFGVKRATFYDWAQSWKNAGEIEIKSSGKTTEFRSPRKAKAA